jgi:dipeptidyl aminopeptidase/acylaminoacyl peptidase
MRRLAVFLAAVLLPTVAVRPAGPPAVPGPDRWTVEDVVAGESASDFHISPDGRYALWVKSVPDKEKNEHVDQVFRIDLRTRREVQVTRAAEGCTRPRWSPDGTHVAFLSSRPLPKAKGDDKAKEDDAKMQLWLIDPTGGEPWPLTDGARAVQEFGWAGAGAIVFTAQEDSGRRETVRKDDLKDTTVVVEDETSEPPVRLFRIDVKTKKVTRLSDNRDRIERLAVSPNGKHAVTLHARSLRYLYDNKIKPILFLVDVDTGKRQRIFANPQLNISSIRWSPDSKGFYATDEHSSKPQLAQASVTELHHHDVATHKEIRVDLDWPRGLVAQSGNDHAPGVVSLADGFLALLADGVRHRAARYVSQNGRITRRWLTGEHASHLFGLEAAPDGKTLLYATSTASSPTQWYHATLTGERIGTAKPIASCNEHLSKRRKARMEVVRWKGAWGEEVEGLLYYPHDYQRGKKAPLVVQIHGGPAMADHDAWEERWSYAPNLLCQRGAFVLKPNYHGSSDYGLKWLDSIADGKYCEPELEDIEKGVDALIARGLVDPARLGLQGWSNGAILTNALITRTTRYRAASAGAGTVEYVSDWASCEFGEAFDRYYLGRSPLEDLPLYLKKSPFHSFNKVRTPTLIFFGTEDRVVHPQQGWAQYRALQQLGKVPVRFVQFPGEKHSLRKLSHRRRKLQEELAWFDRYLFGQEKARDEVVKDDSPLAWALKRQAAKKVDGRYGILLAGVLVPETIKHGQRTVGRFEVTRAQFAAFDRRYPVQAGKENYPASGITFEQALAYCEWLSKKTGRRYHLPTEAEADELYGKPEGGENTLDRWAGYAVNPDDAVVLRAKLKTLGKGALLEEVGRGRGTGKDELVYDLGGNVAEWVRRKDGKGVLRGGSADRPADVRGGGQEAGEEYRGLRVVVD